MNDKLQSMWDQQREFMQLLCKKRNFPKFPVDMTTKEGQKFLKSITHDCQDELAEANQVLRNSKNHRETNVSDFDREHYVEEICDAMHYMLEIVIASGISIDEFYEAYMSKGAVNVKRINEGY